MVVVEVQRRFGYLAVQCFTCCFFRISCEGGSCPKVWQRASGAADGRCCPNGRTALSFGVF